jgi:hypothetical protein
MEKAYVTLSPNSWHSKLVKLVLGEAAPTPQNMNNFCPYWWLLIFSLLTCAIVLPVRFIFYIWNVLIEAIENIVEKTMVEPAAKAWEDKLVDLDVYQIWMHHEELNKLYRKFHGYEKGGYSKDVFVAKWFETKKGVPAYKVSQLNYREASPEFSNWIAEQHEVYSKICQEEETAKRNQPYVPTYDEKLENFRDNVGDFFGKVSNTVASWKNIIKWTKRVTGALVTGVLLTVTYFVVNFLGKGILWLVDHWNWTVVLDAGIGIAILGTIAFLGWLFSKLVTYMANRGTDLWYIKVAYSFLFWCVWTPLKFILYTFLWQLVIVNLSYLIAAGAKGFWKGLIGFLGIFGEYFGASYTDYCPGIRWEGVSYPEDAPVIMDSPVVSEGTSSVSK